MCFEWFGKAYERRKYLILLATPMDTTCFLALNCIHVITTGVKNKLMIMIIIIIIIIIEL